MRLLHTKWLTFREFYDSDIPPYAILSHRWIRDEEISYETFVKPHQRGGAGYRKIKEFCHTAQCYQDEELTGLDWIWIDTCCIDKRNSAELSETINSMWRWYKGARICFAYLCDVDAQSTT